MTLSDFSIKRPVFAWILMFGLIFFGLLSFRKMGINENPDVEFPVVEVQYSYPGATPEVIEKDVIEPVESVLVSMEGIRDMSSTADRGNGRIRLEFELDKNIDFALQEINTLLSRAQRSLPGTLDPPVVTKSNAADEPILYLVITSKNLSQREMMILFRDRIQDRLATIEGVAEIRAFGYHEPVLRIDLDAQKLKRYQLTALDVVSSLKREHKELPAGKFEFNDREDLIRIMGEVSRVEEFQNMVISRRGGSPNYIPLRLKDVANIYEGVEPLRRISRVDGESALAMAIQKQRGVNSVATADRVLARLDVINKDLPEGTALSVNFDRTQFIRESVHELIFTIVLSALLTSLVCWLFIGSWSATVNILLAIPTSIVGTFIFIHWLGFTLNTFSLLGLALAIGVVVDDAIVMLENIVRYMQNGFDRVNSAFKGAREISFAVIATTVALVSIFIPISFMPGIEGRFFFEFAVTISIAVALSSLESLTLAPMRSSQFLEVRERKSWLGRNFEKGVERTRASYAKLLDWALHHYRTSVLVSLGVFLISLLSLTRLSTEFVPAQDSGVLFLNFQAPDGKSMNYTVEKVVEFEKLARAHPDVKRVFVAVGGFGQGGQGNRGNGIVVLKNARGRGKSQSEVAADLREQAKGISGIRAFIQDRFGGALGGRRGSPIEFTLRGPDPQRQKEIFQSLKEKMDADSQIVGTRSDDVSVIPEVHLVPNRERALRSGVEVDEVAGIINAAFGGVAPTQYTSGGRRFDTFVQLAEPFRQTSDSIRSLLLRNNRGEILSLGDVVDVKETQGPQVIYRENRVRGLRVDANLSEGAIQGDVVKRIQDWAREVVPEGYSVKFGETPQDKLMETLVIMLLGLIVAYMILASQFNSFVDPLLVFLAIPFGLTGSLLALLIGGQTLNIYSAIGILLTMGIVKKNSILLIEFTNQLRDQGEEILSAIKKAGGIRLRPILMTNTATLAAAIPPALALGPGAETRVPMALTVIGGVLVSVLFTIIVVPCVYYWVAPKRIHVLEENEGPFKTSRKNPTAEGSLGI